MVIPTVYHIKDTLRERGGASHIDTGEMQAEVPEKYLKDQVMSSLKVPNKMKTCKKEKN